MRLAVVGSHVNTPVAAAASCRNARNKSEHRVNNRLLQPVVTGCRSVTMLTSAKRACPLFLPVVRACSPLCFRSSAGSASFSSVFPATKDWSQSKIPDQSGKTFLITGSNAGLGFEAAKKLSANKGHVIMATRNPDKAKQAIEDIKKEVGEHASFEFLHVDLTDFSTVKEAAEKLKQRPIDVLVNNASVAAPKDDLGGKTVDGFEITMSTNHFGPHLFTKLLLENVKSAAPSRIIYQGASGESMAKLNWDDLKGEQKEDSTLIGEYAQTKLMNIMMAREWNQRLHGSGIDVLSCQPGVSHSAIYEKAETSKPDVKAIDINQKVAGQSQERGATALLYTCTADELTGKGFAYIGPKYFTGPINLNIGQTKDRDPKNPEANNLVACARLFDMTEEIMQPFY